MAGRLFCFARCSVGLAVLNDATVALAGSEKVRGAALNDVKQVVLVHMSVTMVGRWVVVVMLNAASPHSRLEVEASTTTRLNARATELTRHVNADRRPLQAPS